MPWKFKAHFENWKSWPLKKAPLGNARKMMADADKAKLQKIAPSAYGVAETALNEAEIYAGQNPYEAEIDQPEESSRGVHGPTVDGDQREQQNVSIDDSGIIRHLCGEPVRTTWTGPQHR